MRVRHWIGPALVAALILGYGIWAAAHLGGTYWDSDEGINLMKARMFQLGYGLYTEIWADQPPGLTAALAGVFAAFGPSIELARGLVLSSALIGLIGVAWVAREAGGGWPAAGAAVVFAATAPNFFWASRAVMIGLPALCLSTVAIGAALAYTRTGRRAWLVAAGLLLGLSLTVKLIGAYLVVPFGLAIVLAQRDRRSMRDALLGILRDGALFAIAVAVTWLPIVLAFDAPLMVRQVVGTVSAARGAYTLDLAWNLDKLGFWLLGDQLALCAAAAYGALVLTARRSSASMVVLAWGATTLVALALQTPLWPKHHFLALLVVMAPIAGIGLEDVAQRVWSRRWRSGRDLVWLATGAAALAVTLVGVRSAVRADSLRTQATPYKESGKLPSNQAYKFQDQATSLLEANSGPDDFVVTDYNVIAFNANRRLPPELCVISGKRMAVDELTAADVISVTEEYDPAAILFWSGDRLQRLPGYREWVERNYLPAARIGDEFELYVRPGAPSRDGA